MTRTVTQSRPDVIRLLVLGNPAPKGSMRGFVIPSKSGRPRAALVPQNPTSLREWVENIRQQALAAVDPSGRFEGPVSVSIEFYLRRPKALVRHRRPWPTKRPDVDKLVRAVLDALTDIVWSDDSQVVQLNAAKRYVDPRATPARAVPRATIQIERLG